MRMTTAQRMMTASASPYGRQCPPGMSPRYNSATGRAECVPDLGPPPHAPTMGVPPRSMLRSIPPGIRPARGMGLNQGDMDMATATWAVVSTASMALSAYHGYKRNDSVGWALWWGLVGGAFPVLTPAIAIAQGFGKRKR